MKKETNKVAVASTASYTLEFKLDAIRLVKGGQAAAVTAEVLGVAPQTLSTWIKVWPVTPTCEVLGVHSSGYFEHCKRKAGSVKPSRSDKGRMSSEVLLTHIRAIHEEVKQEYGWPKMWKQLQARGHRVGNERVRVFMNRYGIKARGKRKFFVTTDSKHSLPIAQNLLARNFTPKEPNQVWTQRYHLHRDWRGLALSGSSNRPF